MKNFPDIFDTQCKSSLIKERNTFNLHCQYHGAVENLVKQGARASATMVLTDFTLNIPITAPESLIIQLFIFNVWENVVLHIDSYATDQNDLQQADSLKCEYPQFLFVLSLSNHCLRKKNCSSLNLS